MPRELYQQKNMKKVLTFTALILVAALSAIAQDFHEGALYQIQGIPTEYDGQVFTMSEISGSWRIIDPSTHTALRVGDHGLEFGEENGSDELQKWLLGKKISDTEFSFINTQDANIKLRLRFKEVANASNKKDAPKSREKSPIWEDETVFAQNKLPGIATYMPYATEKEMLADKAYYKTPWTEPKSSLYLSLDGTWQFSFHPEGTPLHEFDNNLPQDFTLTGHESIPVPSCWEMQGYDRPIYCNVEYPHGNTPPYITARKGYNDEGKNYAINPVGIYRRTFQKPAHWKDGRPIIHFGGIYSAARIWLNGKYVGYTQGANNVSEFDLTDYIVDGDNDLLVEVHRWSDGSYLECQDMFRMSGIFRSVYVYNVPAESIRNHIVKTLTTAEGKWKVYLEVDADVNAMAMLYSPSGKFLASCPIKDKKAEFTVVHPELWSAEEPNLYTMHIVQYDGTNHEQMAFSTKVGIRNVEIRNSQLLVNGKRVILKGTNRHDTHPETGRTVPVECLLKDVTMMKQNNINCVRTSHYPNDARLYAMFDYFGIYCCDEADVEDHANQTISSKKSWIPAFEDRIERLVTRDINHPSVLFWSMGNECGVGSNFLNCYNTARRLDPTRPVHYEGTRIDKPYGGSAYSDFYSKMYPSMEWMEENTSNLDKPMFLCEFAHAMGNAIGNLPEYMEAIENSNACIGGCIWDWVDQAIYEPNELKLGIRRLHTGYDFPGPHQGNFCSNGIVTAEREYTSKLAEVKAAYQYIGLEMAGENGEMSRVKVTNKYTFRSLKGLDLEIQLREDGYVRKKKTVHLPDVKPGESFEVPCQQFFSAPRGGKEWVLTCVVRNTKATSYSPKGHEVAHWQNALTVPDDLPQLPAFMNLIYDAFGMEFQPQFNRWIENDRGAWAEAKDKATCNIAYTQLASADNGSQEGAVDVTVTITPKDGDLRRAGVCCQLDTTLCNVSYYGEGPWENYCDRRASTLLGRYSCTVDELGENYINPQSMGDRFVREVSLTDNKGHGFRIQCPEGLYFSANRYTDEDLFQARHQWELQKRPFIYLQLSREIRGLGNASCGPATMMRYRIQKDEPIKYTFRITKI